MINPRVYISVVSHGHAALVMRLGCLERLASVPGVTIALKNNIQKDSSLIATYASNIRVALLDERYGLGFGANNNLIFRYCKQEMGMRPDDIFLIMNPDVVIDEKNINDLVMEMQTNMLDFCCVDLYKDPERRIRDLSIRHFPTAVDFVRSFLGLGNPTQIDRSKIGELACVDWAAGSLLAVRARIFELLNGFDESYFMYCEDVDFCWRAKKNNCNLVYLPGVQALHYAAHNNRRIFSRNFYWHLKSAFRFLRISGRWFSKNK